MFFRALVGFAYTIERTFGLEEPAWTPVEVFPGTGDLILFTRPINTFTNAFFRLRAE